ncbi:hypothetical protein GCM10010435_53210 [Winogradskya consettensis]|uniref:HEXXH motif domain-containing protein n=1 Tax=Winogradskya consettensis TaxID=113560 RepID=A0A919SGV6_9ACTN|nr:HEXXH motif-containing putative peptide modification protein [Actinoplanes consettensis]GIM71630.1 hypothetical protein Aco04nite_26230 [Actinoplanes consettensis]
MSTAALADARPHRLSDAALASLGAGRPDRSTIAELKKSQLSRNLLLLHEIAAVVGPGPLTDLAEAERANPARVRELIARPLFGVWAASCLRDLQAGRNPDVSHLTDIARAARIPRQQPDKSLRANHNGHSITVRVDDSNPLREKLGLPPAPPLDAEQLARWQRTFTEAWRLLVTSVPADAEVLATVLDCVVPVLPDPAARGISATSADAFGAVAISEPADATALAVGLLHETQHSILNAVQYLFDLLDKPATLGYSPWRDDPRPASGILHGAYAYLTVTRFWRTRSTDPLAQFEFARWRAAVSDAAGGLRDLTPAGARFVAALTAEVRPWLDEPVDPGVLRLAGSANRDHYLRWRLRNRHVDPAGARELRRAWHAGEARPNVTSELRPAPKRALEASARLDLTHRFLRGDPLTGPRGEPLTGSDGDVAYVRGDAAAALRAYPDDWVGLILAGGFDVAPELAAVLSDEPDRLAILGWLS